MHRRLGEDACGAFAQQRGDACTGFSLAGCAQHQRARGAQAIDLGWQLLQRSGAEDHACRMGLVDEGRGGHRNRDCSTAAGRTGEELFFAMRRHTPGPIPMRAHAPCGCNGCPPRLIDTMLFPTTIVGSFPQPEWLIDRAKLAGRFPPRVRAKELWRVAEPYLQQAWEDATLIAIRAQEDAGLDIITDGEIRRESYSNRFATALEGVDLDNPGSALDRSGHPNPVPRITGPIRRKHAVEVEDLLFLKANTTKQDQDHRARPVHDELPGAERFLRQRRRSGDGLRHGGQRRDPRPLRRRRRHRADRRALHAGAAREGAPVRPGGIEPRAGRHQRHDGGAHLLRLRRHHPRAPERLLASCPSCAAAAASRSRSKPRRASSTVRCWRSSTTSRSWSAASTCRT